MLYRRTPANCGAEPQWVVELDVENDPSKVKRVLTAGPRFTGAQAFYRKTDGSCVSGPLGEYPLYEGGTEDSEVLQVSEVIE